MENFVAKLKYWSKPVVGLTMFELTVSDLYRGLVLWQSFSSNEISKRCQVFRYTYHFASLDLPTTGTNLYFWSLSSKIYYLVIFWGITLTVLSFILEQVFQNLLKLTILSVPKSALMLR